MASPHLSQLWRNLQHAVIFIVLCTTWYTAHNRTEHIVCTLLTWLDDFASWIFHHDLSAVQMFQDELKTAKCFDQADLVGHVQVVSVSFIRLEKDSKTKKEDDYRSWQNLGVKNRCNLNYCNYLCKLRTYAQRYILPVFWPTHLPTLIDNLIRMQYRTGL